MPTEAGEAAPHPPGGIREQTWNGTFAAEPPVGITRAFVSPVQTGEEKPHWFSDVHPRYDQRKQKEGASGSAPER